MTITSKSLVAIAVAAALAGCGQKEAAPEPKVDTGSQAAPAEPVPPAAQAAEVTYDETLEYAGISVVVAKSFARIFYRNAVNLGYPILESDAVDHVGQNDELEVDADAGVIRNLTTGEEFSCTTLSGLERDISAAGGLIPYLRKELDLG